MSDDRIARQIAFLIRADHLKTVIRRTPLIDNSRLENSAEHSWHLTLAALALAEHAPSRLDIGRVLQLLVVHDLVEIDAGDTFAYDPAAHVDKSERERAAAEKIFGVLPDNQRAHLRALWDEFEAFETRESKFANALDRFQALLLNSQSGGGSWATHRVTRPALWSYVLDAIDRACDSGAMVRD
jgi:5'-deoxynucleotidase YfbR-like HD superfamily hydrolase